MSGIREQLAHVDAQIAKRHKRASFDYQRVHGDYHWHGADCWLLPEGCLERRHRPQRWPTRSFHNDVMSNLDKVADLRSDARKYAGEWDIGWQLDHRANQLEKAVYKDRLTLW